MRSVTGIIVKGHQVASGTSAEDRRFAPLGTLRMQAPVFAENGLDLTKEVEPDWFPGTINLSLNPLNFKILKPDFHLQNIRWTDVFDTAERYFTENFFLVRIGLLHRQRDYKGLLYLPDPETKLDHYKPAGLMDLISTPVADCHYGDALTLIYDPAKIDIQ